MFPVFAASMNCCSCVDIFLAKGFLLLLLLLLLLLSFTDQTIR